eukprot:3932886-Rhodomonas_salina.1
MSGTERAYAATSLQRRLSRPLHPPVQVSPLSPYPPPRHVRYLPTRPCAMSGTDTAQCGAPLRAYMSVMH